MMVVLDFLSKKLNLENINRCIDDIIKYTGDPKANKVVGDKKGQKNADHKMVNECDVVLWI